MHGQKTDSEEIKSGETQAEKKASKSSGSGDVAGAARADARDDGEKKSDEKGGRRAKRRLARLALEKVETAEVRKKAKAKIEAQIAFLNQKIHLL